MPKGMRKDISDAIYALEGKDSEGKKITKTKKKTVGEFIKEKGIEIPKYNIRT